MKTNHLLKMYKLKAFVIYLIFTTYNATSISLNGKWKGYIESTGVLFTAEVPGGIYTDLEKAGLIPENLVGFNDVNNRWVANESIAYTTNFEVNDALLNAPHVTLIFHGVDTFATIYINNVEVGKTLNMFLKYTFEIKHNLKTGLNELKVVFESSVKVAEKLYNIQSANYVVPPKCVPKEYNGECHVNHIRKMHASYGWDWGPAFPSMGLWRGVELVPVQDVMVSEISADVFKETDAWQVLVTVFFKSFGDKNVDINETVQIKCDLENKYLNESSLTNLKIKNNEVSAHVKMTIPLDKVEKWWPNGYGKQRLYLLNVKVKIGSEIIEKEMKVGFRSVELIQEPLQKGLSFYFKVNDVPIFAKGSNWIPSNIFPENLEKHDTLYQLLDSAKETHMNMLRVWGGGVYESDLFYSIADEYGIMIWQDFMFACNMYPTNSEFLNTVKEEVRQNMIKLKHHPSIVLWAGNNENEAALYGNWYGTGTEQIYKDDYVKLYADTIKNEAMKVDSARPFVISSPSNGIYSEEQNYTQSNPYSNFYGDVHYYNYLKNGWDINQYPVTRFASEYGFQALPSIWTMMSATQNASDLQWKSPFMNHRQHLPLGNSYMKLLISKNFNIPSNSDKTKELINYIYLSQVTQAVSMRIQTELYRQMKSSFNDIGEGMTMGALYWQLNDVWQAPSWSSIDFKGRWKMLHYYVKDFFSPVIITSRLTKANELLIYVVSDLLQSLINLTVEVNVYEWSKAKSIKTYEYKNVTVGPNESRLITQYWIDILLEKSGCGTLAEAKDNCMIELILKDINGKQVAPTNYVYPQPLKKVSLPNDTLTIKIEQKHQDVKEKSGQTTFEIELTSEKLSLFVWLEVGNILGKFSENGFHILHGRKNIVFYTSQTTTVKDITNNLFITSLSRIYDSDLRSLDLQVVTDYLKQSNQV